MVEKISDSRFIGDVGSICSIIASLLTIVQIVGILPNVFKVFLVGVPYLTLVLLVITVIAYWYDNKKLRRYVHEGMKYTNNTATVLVNISRKSYSLSFEKHFELISDSNPKWYKAQFYCNRYLGNSEETRKYYSENPPKWKDLKVFASMRYKQRADTKYSKPVQLRIVPITDNSYYIPFHIHYEELNGDSGYLPLVNGTKVILNYGYEVPAELWGSYLNRTLSFFGEKAKVFFKYPNIDNLKVEVSLHRLLPNDSSPQKIRDCDITSIDSNFFVHEIDLPSKSCAKYRVWWKSEMILAIPSVDNVVDDSKMTDY